LIPAEEVLPRIEPLNRFFQEHCLAA